MNCKQLDSYSLLITSKYFETAKDYVNIICVNSKFKETTEKLRYNPIPIKSKKLFPKIQTQYMYSEKDKKIKGIDNYLICHKVTYDHYLKYKRDNIIFQHVAYTKQNKTKYGDRIPDGVNVLDNYCFGSMGSFSENENGIRDVTILPSIKSLGIGCFSDCASLTSINLSSKLTSLGVGCFSGCYSLTTINLPSLLKKIGDNCFCGCASLKSVILPNSLVEIGDYCFMDCLLLKSINLPSSLNILNDGCFYNCRSLQSINFPSSLTSINWGCFYDCTLLESINLPLILKDLHKGCFYGCDKLKKITKIPKECFDQF
ncbi:Leucine rich repeat protein bspa family [Entamoeba marina]